LNSNKLLPFSLKKKKKKEKEENKENIGKKKK